MPERLRYDGPESEPSPKRTLTTSRGIGHQLCLARDQVCGPHMDRNVALEVSSLGLRAQKRQQLRSKK